MERYEYCILAAFVIAIPCAIVYAYHIGKWTYADAKSRGMKPRLWTMLVLGSQNGAGLTLYLLKRKKRNKEVSTEIAHHQRMAISACAGLITAILLLLVAMFLSFQP